MIKLYHGKNQYLSLKEAKTYYHQLLIKMSDADNIQIDGENMDAAQMIEIYDTQGMFSQKKVLFIKRLQENKNSALLIEHLLNVKQPTEDIEIVLWENKKIPANTKYYKFIRSYGEVYESPELNKRTFNTWAKQEATDQGLSIDNAANAELCSRCNYDPERFSNELKKFKLLKDKVSLDEVKALTTDTYESDIWKLIDSINYGDRVESTTVLENLLRNRLDAHYILSMMYRNIRLITQVKFLVDKGFDSRSIASQLKLPPFTVPSLIKSATRYDQERLERIYERLTNLDFQIKIGEIEPQIGLTLITSIL